MTEAGRVGIGTTAPTTALHVVGNTTLTGSVHATSTGLSSFTNTTAQGKGVVGIATGSTSIGVHGYSDSGYGVLGTNAASSGPPETSSTCERSRSHGQHQLDQGAQRRCRRRPCGSRHDGTPVAYGTFSNTGTMVNGSPNLSCTWDTVYTQALCTIASVTYSGSSYVAIATVENGMSQNIAFANVGDDGAGHLTVHIFQFRFGAFSPVQDAFHVVVYKPI